MKEETKEELIKRVNNKMNRVSKEKILSCLEELNKKKSKPMNYISVPAKVKVEGKTYHTIMFRPLIAPKNYFEHHAFLENDGDWLKLNSQNKSKEVK